MATYKLDTLHLTNHHFHVGSSTSKLIMGASALAAFTLILMSPSTQTAVLSIIAVVAVGMYGYYLILKSKVSYTLTASHFQQHLFKGGWVIKWNNISNIGLCTYNQDGWLQPLPWIGIKLKQYSPYIDSICPRIVTEILMTQRTLLYLGARQHGREGIFEDIVLDSDPYKSEDGKKYRGLLAMLANRMQHQREFHEYDIFIAVSDLDRSGEEFVGLARRYLAAAEPESNTKCES
ncbi:DUF2982 domain-containing protein [Vibrio marisflavi]|uniref:DUF2982 domain-containing protein n=1 Tax=Vibrio marisflavi CECT 7928 TaxID=634439 RepID=A0ABN8E2Z6_9VIBR|nr:DUF2982 domain-containing protein [Vibrio marisflavi]CAH0539597.1 hypothetical protein VMF7928_02272 [Vibrio marisflavi CECT 7928]